MNLNPQLQKDIVDDFHKLFYYSDHTWGNGMTWMGIDCHQNPLDMWILQEIIFKNRPTVIIETGTMLGGSALFFANMMDAAHIEGGIVITIDVLSNYMADHKRIMPFSGEKSTSLSFIEEVKKAVKPSDKVMVMLDSDHSTDNVIDEMRMFSQFVTKGQYMVVCDGNVGGNPVENPFVQGPGPMRAIEMFMQENKEFEVDMTKEKFYFTFCPNGWLKRK